MAGTIIVSSIKTDTDNSFIVRSNTGATLFSVDTTSISIPNGSITSAMIANGAVIAADVADGSITDAKITAVANTKITGLITSAQIANVANTQVTGSIEATQVGTTVSQLFGMRNRIINGAMEIDQRNAGASVTPVNGQFITDRFAYITTQSSKATSQQSSVAPTGFINSLLFTSSSAYSAAAGDLIAFTQAIEGFNIADLGWGTANAKTVTLSFQVRSSLTGTFGGCFRNEAGNRFYVFSYSIPAANTWTTISITIPGDTTGTWETNNSAGIRLYFNLGCGTTYSGAAGSWGTTAYYNVTGGVNLVGTNGATFYITGVQLEVGSTATPFERRMYTNELQLCQRYYHRITTAAAMFGSAFAVTSTQARSVIPFPVTMRIVPTALEQTGTASNYGVFFNNTTTTCSSVPTFSAATTLSAQTVLTVSSGLTGGQAGNFYDNSPGSNAYLGWSAEL